MAGYDQASENKNWQRLRDKAVADLMNLLDAQADLAAQIETQNSLIQLLEALLKPPE